jgi:hypothetical protein
MEGALKRFGVPCFPEIEVYRFSTINGVWEAEILALRGNTSPGKGDDNPDGCL